MAPKFSILTSSNENSQKIYFPGQVVEGTICLDLDKELAIEGIQFKISGQAEVYFTKDRTISEPRTITSTSTTGYGFHTTTGIASYNQTMHYGAQEKFFQYKLPIGINDRAILPAGFHEFPFTFTLPLGLPSSYNKTHGRVTYLLCLDVKIQEKIPFFGITKTEKRVVVPLTIIGILDLKNEPGVELPVEIAFTKGSLLSFFKCGQSSFKLTIPRKGFVPGESIRFLVEINNFSRKIVNSMEMALVQKIKYHGTLVNVSGGGSTRSAPDKEIVCLSEVILQQIRPGVAKGDSELWDPGFSFKIPPIPPTKLAGLAKIIDVEYCLHFEARIDLSYNISKDIPIIIGTIPLALYPADKPPPSYAEANLSRFRNRNTLGNGNEPTAPAGQIV